ncbi:MAG TPA: DUF6544 family protein [Bacillota bacterium]|nr:DUF6544 family protein [Bacillota bacterium]
MKRKTRLFIVVALMAIMVLLIGIGVRKFMAISCKGIYKTEVQKRLTHIGKTTNPLLTENDIQHLPEPVQKYLHYVGAIGKERVNNIRTFFSGDFKIDPKRDWMKIKTEQYDFFTHPTRLFFIQGNMWMIPMKGYDFYSQGKGNMRITIASLITVADVKGPEADIAEMATLFNDMCLLAPATLIDNRIDWEPMDPLTVKGCFQDGAHKVSAILYFNEQGELINFVTEDRYFAPIGQTPRKVKWSTPVRRYQEFGGVKVVSEADAIWHLTEGDLCYAKFKLQEIEYNCRRFK